MLVYLQRDKKCEEDVVVGGEQGVQVNGFIYLQVTDPGISFFWWS